MQHDDKECRGWFVFAFAFYPEERTRILTYSIYQKGLAKERALQAAHDYFRARWPGYSSAWHHEAVPFFEADFSSGTTLDLVGRRASAAFLRAGMSEDAAKRLLEKFTAYVVELGREGSGTAPSSLS